MGFLDQIKTPSKTPSNGLKSSTPSSGGFLDKIVTSPQNSQPEATQPTKTPLGQGVSLSGPLGGIAKSTQAIPTESTPNITPVSVVKSILQGTARAVGTVGITAGNLPYQLAKQENPFQETIPTDQSKITRTVFGGEPIKTVQQRMEDTRKTLEPIVGKQTAGLFSATPVVASIALDLSGWGGSKSVKNFVPGEVPETFFKYLGKEKNAIAIEKTLLDVGMTAEYAKPLSIQFAKTKTAQEAKDVLSVFDEVLKAPKLAAEANIASDIRDLPLSIEQKSAMQALREGATTPDILKVVKTIDPKVFEAPKGGFLDQIQKPQESKAITTGNVPETKIPAKVPVYEGETDLTTKILKDLEGKSTVSRQYILDATNRGELKQSERDITRQVLDTMPDGQINVKEFADKVKSELLPLKRNTRGGQGRYENISLPIDIRGNVANYKENIYESPIKTSAGKVHFGHDDGGGADNYFGHTRIEDMADNKTRRVIEVQSDLYQKGRLEDEMNLKRGDKVYGKEGGKYGVNDYYKIVSGKYEPNNPNSKIMVQSPMGHTPIEKYSSELKLSSEVQNRITELSKLQQYNDPTAHFRMIREEIKKAAQDGKTKLQFPTGETAMKIEGLGDQASFRRVGGQLGRDGRAVLPLDTHELEVGMEIVGNTGLNRITTEPTWIITDVLGDGKFKAIPKRFEQQWKTGKTEFDPNFNSEAVKETFDISGKVDTSNPIYKFYEKDLGKYLNKFGAQKVTDSKGVTWYEVPISKSQDGAVEAFNKKRPLLTKDIYKTRDEIRDILFKDIPKEDVKLIFTNELIQGIADGSFQTDKRLGNIIKLFEKDGKVSLITALHESKHYLFSKLSPEVQNEAYAIAKKEMGPLYKSILEKQYGDVYTGPDKTNQLLEEYIVDQWAKADAAKGFGYKKSVFGKIFTALDNLLKRMVNTYNKVKARAEAMFKERGGSKGGYINFGGEKPKKTPLGKSVGKVTIGGKEVDITKGGTMDIPVAKAKVPVAKIIKDIPPKTKELITQDLFNEYSQVEAKRELKDEKAIKDILTFKERQDLIKSEIDMSKLEKENIESSISEEAKGLMKYKSKVTGELPEVTGKEKVSSPTTGKQIENSLFGRRGDQIVQGLGFKDLDSAQKAFDTYLVQRARVNDIKKTISEKVKDYRDKKQIIEAVEAMLRKEGRERANQVSLIQDFFKLSDSEFKEITKKTPDFRLMTDDRFQGLLKEVYNKSYDAFTLAEARMKLKATIFEKELLKVDNLQQAEKLPKIENMSLSQLENFNTLLESFKQGDAFLGVRQLQTIKNTDLAGIKTKREVIEDLSKRTGKPIDQLKDISVNKFVDRMLYDTALARKNPFYEILVDDTNTALVGASLRFTEVSNKVDDLMAKARSSRKRGLVDRIIPTDDLIFSYLEASPEEKLVIMKRMTKEEADASLFIQEKYAEARDYLVQREQLKTRYWDNYITHLPTGFLETWKSGIKDFNLKKAINDVLASFKEQEKIVNILDQKTGSVLPLEKFMRFTLTREGFSASHDVARAVTAYFRVFENKIALDQIIPKLDVYVHVLTPQKMTPRGLEFDDSLKTFWKEWMNNKKGRISAGIIKQGTAPMWAVKSGIAFTRILDLGLNLPVGLASHIGEQVGTFVNLGTKKYTLGLARYSTPTGRAIAEKYQGFVGETLLQKLSSPTMGLKDKVTTTLFGLFSSADRKANIVHLLGSMSPEEFKTKTISVERLGKLKTEIGKYRVTHGDASIWQKTALGQVAYQYKKWAEPIMLTNVNNIKKVSSMLKNGDKSVIHTTEFKELFRSVVVTSLAVVISYGLYSELRDKKEKNFLENLAFKAMNDSLSMLSALNPNTYTSYRLLSFIKDITASLTLISSSLIMNDRTAKGLVPGLSTLKSNITPKLVKQFKGKEKTIGENLHDQFIKSKDKRGFLANLLETDPDGADKLIAELQKEALGITDEDEKIKNMGVKNGQRAEAINKKLKKLKTTKEREALLTDYVEKGILTEDVMVQLVDLK